MTSPSSPVCSVKAILVALVVLVSLCAQQAPAPAQTAPEAATQKTDLFAHCSLAENVRALVRSTLTQKTDAFAITAVSADYGRWDTARYLGPFASPHSSGSSFNGWGVKIVAKNITNGEAAAYIGPTTIQLEDTAGKRYDIVDDFWHSFVQFGGVDKHAASYSIFKGSVETAVGNAWDFQEGGSKIGTLVAFTADERLVINLSLSPQKSVTLLFVFDAPADSKPKSLLWPDRESIPLPAAAAAPPSSETKPAANSGSTGIPGAVSAVDTKTDTTPEKPAGPSTNECSVFVITGLLKNAEHSPMPGMTVFYLPRTETKDKKGVVTAGVAVSKRDFGWSPKSFSNPGGDTDATGLFKIEVNLANQWVATNGDVFTVGFLGRGFDPITRDSNNSPIFFKVDRQKCGLDLGDIVVHTAGR